MFLVDEVNEREGRQKAARVWSFAGIFDEPSRARALETHSFIAKTYTLPNLQARCERKLLYSTLSLSLSLSLSRVELAVEGREARQSKHDKIRLARQLGAPVPRGREPPVDARARVEEVVGAAAVEGELEKVL